jgi:NAD(P)-dependent dehydrogenase (short-subunit alcohol dehydrogenase family)
VDLDLAGRTAIVTGAASGLGRETALVLAGEGAKIVVADQNEAGIEKTVIEIRSRGGQAQGVAIDVRRYDDCERMAAIARERFGGVDVLVAGAGVMGPEGFFLETRPEDWATVLGVNLLGVLNSCHAVAPHLVERGRGSIVTIASEAGKLGEKRMVVYGATKGGVIGFSKAFAVEMGRFGVRVNAVCPGVTNTPMTAGWPPEQKARAAKMYPLGRLGEPADIASMIAFLASEQSSWITGQAISVSGGFGRA